MRFDIMRLFRRSARFLRRCAAAVLPGPAEGMSHSHPSYAIAYEPDLLPPPELMRTEGIDVLEEWFRWGEEWSMLLRVYGGITRPSTVLEIGCGLGRVAFPLRFVLSEEGSYDGFDICRYKIDFLDRFHEAYPHFRFRCADVRNAHYNPSGAVEPSAYRFPYTDGAFDIVFAASVFTHLLPEATAHYFAESARVLKPGGRCVFSFFLLDHYRQGHPRPLGFARPEFDVSHTYGGYGDDFAVSDPHDPEAVSAYSRSAIEGFASKVGLTLAQEPVPGLWSGTSLTWVGAQDVIVLTKP